jgi:SAM-dependent methyltransferase
MHDFEVACTIVPTTQRNLTCAKSKIFSLMAKPTKGMGRWSRIVGGVFLDWLAVPNGLRWIDVGCGNGAFTEVLIARCAPSAVSAVDPSEGQLTYARTRPAAKLAEFRVGDAQALPYPDRSFDAAATAVQGKKSAALFNGAHDRSPPRLEPSGLDGYRCIRYSSTRQCRCEHNYFPAPRRARFFSCEQNFSCA